MSLEARDDLTGEQPVRLEGGRAVGPVVAQHQEGAEPARLLDQALDVGDGVVGRADDHVARVGVGLHVVARRLRPAVDLVGQRDEAGAAAEVVGERLEPVGAVVDGPVVGLGQVHGAEDAP
ncbi:MAG TPA: hypothetical protein VFZ30_08960, partial [Acidimicrobiales bacterium]